MARVVRAPPYTRARTHAPAPAPRPSSFERLAGSSYVFTLLFTLLLVPRLRAASSATPTCEYTATTTFR